MSMNVQRDCERKKNIEHMKPITEHICKNIQSPSRKRILPNVEIFDVIKNDL